MNTPNQPKRFFDHWPVHHLGLLWILIAILLAAINIGFMYYDETFYPILVIISCFLFPCGLGYWLLHPRHVTAGDLFALSAREQVNLLWTAANWWQKIVWVCLILGGLVGGVALAIWLEG